MCHVPSIWFEHYKVTIREVHKYSKVCQRRDMILIYLLTAVGLPPGGSSTVHIYTQTIYGTTQLKKKNNTINRITQFTKEQHN
jgi:hypothetical protein